MRVALFGGSFNPPHVGHLLAATLVRAVGPVDEVWLMPAHHHPFGKQLVPFEQRVTLCEALASMVDGVKVSRVEAELDEGGRTLHTVEHLMRRHPGHRFRLVVGTDILHEAPKWHAFERLTALAPLIVLGRSGHAPMDLSLAMGTRGALDLTHLPLPAVSSTEIRHRLSVGADASSLVPGPVLRQLHSLGLYR
jgi:nicotinate-nucleotide adenylyltransferase